MSEIPTGLSEAPSDSTEKVISLDRWREKRKEKRSILEKLERERLHLRKLVGYLYGKYGEERFLGNEMSEEDCVLIAEDVPNIETVSINGVYFAYPIGDEHNKLPIKDFLRKSLQDMIEDVQNKIEDIVNPSSD